MKTLFRAVSSLARICYLVATDRNFRAWIKLHRPARTNRRPHQRAAVKLTLAERIEVHVGGIICGTAKTLEAVVSLYLCRGFWIFIHGIYQEAFSREIETVLERRNPQ